MISVCLTTYNGEKHLKQQLESILSQLSDKDEVVISDDGSTDKTYEIISSLNDSRIRLVINRKQKSVIWNIENALEHAKGELIFLSDQDDVWLPDKVEKMTSVLKSADLVVSDCLVTNENLDVIHNSFFELNNTKQNKWLALLKNPYLGCCMAFNRKVLNRALPFPKNIPMHDIWLGNVAAFNYKVNFITDKLILYRRHKNNGSTASEKSSFNIFQKLKFRWNVIRSLVSLAG